MSQVGPNLPATLSEVSTAPYTNEAWTNPTNMQGNDSNYASITAASYDNGLWSLLIKTSGYGFGIDADATIDGIEVHINGYAAVGSNSPQYCQLTKDSSAVVGNDLGSGQGAWATSPGETRVIGGPLEKWGVSWTPAEINSANFGVWWANQANGNNADIYIDWIGIVVYYTLAAGRVPRSGVALCDVAIM